MKKKLLSTLLTVSMIAALAVGCGNSSSGEDSGDSQDSSSDGEQTTYEKIMEKGVMTVGTEGTYQPFTYHDENDELTGYDVEVAKAIGEKMGVEVEFSEITWEGLLASLDNGTVDLVLNQVGVTDEREEKYDFTDPYLYSYIALITTGDNTEIDSWEIFTDAVIRKLSEKRENLIFMLWGSYAKEKRSLIDTNKHLVLTTVHPSPRSAEYGFFGCKHFSKANAFLHSKGIEEIDW